MHRVGARRQVTLELEDLEEVIHLRPAQQQRQHAHLELGLELDEVPAHQVVKPHVGVVVHGRQRHVVVEHAHQHVTSVQIAVEQPQSKSGQNWGQPWTLRR